MGLELTKSFILRKFKYLVLQDHKKVKSDLFDVFLKLNKIEKNKDMSKQIQFSNSMKFNKDELSELLEDDGYTIYDENWNIYDSLYLFFRIMDTNNSRESFEFHDQDFNFNFILYNAEAIVDDLLNKSNESKYTFSSLDD